MASINKVVDNKYRGVTSPADRNICDLFFIRSDCLLWLSSECEIAIINISLTGHIKLCVKLQKLSFSTCYQEVFFIWSPLSSQYSTG